MIGGVAATSVAPWALTALHGRHPRLQRGSVLDKRAAPRQPIAAAASWPHTTRMPKIDLTDEEHAVVRRAVDEDKFPLSPRLAPLRSALAKLAPRPVKPRQELPPLPTGPMVGSRRKARR